MNIKLKKAVSVFLSVFLMGQSTCVFAQQSEYQVLKKKMQANAQKIEESIDENIWKGAGGWVSLGALIASGLGIWNLYRSSAISSVAKETGEEMVEKSVENAAAKATASANPKMVEQVFDVAAYAEKYTYQVSNLYRHYKIMPDGSAVKGLLYRVRPGQEENFVKAVHQIVLEELDKLPPTIRESVLKGDTQFLQRRLGLNSKIKERICTSLRNENLTYLVMPVKEGSGKFVARRTLGSVGRKGIRVLPVVLLGLVLAQPSNAQEEKIAQRVLKDWSLAWNTTAQEEEMFASSERLMQICRDISEQLETLATQDPKDLQMQLELIATDRALAQAMLAKDLQNISNR